MSEITGAWKLTEDVYSNFKKNMKPVLYAKKGDWVNVISDFGNVVIVQCLGGDRFSVNKELLTAGGVISSVEETIKKFETLAKPVIPKKKAAKASVSKPAPTATQQQFFT